MIRFMFNGYARPVKGLGISRSFQFTAIHNHVHRSKLTSEQRQEFRAWLDNFHIPKSDFEITFSRSSGPGGQNVNKVNTKAQIRQKWSEAKWIPPLIKIYIENYGMRYRTQSGDILVQCEETRHQHKNLEICFEKLRHSIIDAVPYVKDLTNEEVSQMRERRRAANEKRLKQKKQNKAKKGFRRQSKDASDD